MVARRELSHSALRTELKLCLAELATDNPMLLWAREREAGLVSGIDEVIHFLFDDHDFDQDEIGRSLLSDTEVAAIGALKDALDRMIDLLPKGTDDDFVDHAGWPQVRRLAAEAGKLFDATD